MAADNRSIVITIKVENTTSKDSDVDIGSKTGTSGSGNGSENIKGASQMAGSIMLAKQAIDIVVGEAIAWGEYAWNRTLTLNDDYIGQRWKTTTQTQINRGIKYGKSIASGIANGAMMGGPIGAVIGGAIAAIGAVAEINRSNQQGWEDQNLHLRQMGAQLDFTRSRAGWSTQAASIGEDL